jgi:hypothetical protein
MSIFHVGNDPFIATEEKGNELLKEIHPALSRLATQTWPELQGRVAELNREVNGATFELAKFREDVTALRTSREAAAAAFEKVRSETRSKVDRLHGAAQSLVDVLRAEVVVKARPRVNPEREAFVRQDLAALLDASSDPLRALLDIAGGSHRDRAAVVVSDFADAHLQRLMSDPRQREQFREGLNASLLEGSLRHGTESERAAATVAKTILPKVGGWVATQTVPAMARLRDAEGLRP